MKRNLCGIFAVVCTLAIMAAWTAPAYAQDEPK